MQAFTNNEFPFQQLKWTCDDLADAVPLRLHEMFAFDANRDAPAANANAEQTTHRGLRRGDFSRVSALTARFRIL
ncbi:MAG: hypothetical protein ABJA62_09580 [Luteimonas sp.]